MRRGLFSLAMVLVVIGLFYAEELWRGRHAWENCKHELQSQGVKLDWASYVPATVADDENVFGVPEMQRWFVKGAVRADAELFFELVFPTNDVPDLKALTPESATAYLKTRDKFQRHFDIIRQALQRPSAQFKGSYADPLRAPVPNLMSAFGLIRTFSLSSKCHRFLGRSAEALNDLDFLNDCSRVLLEEPKPATMLGVWLDATMRRVFANEIGDGIRSQSWSEVQLAHFQDELKQINLLPQLSQALEFEREAVCEEGVKQSPQRLMRKNFDMNGLRINYPQLARWNEWYAELMPRGWMYQGAAKCVRNETRAIGGIEPAEQIVHADKLDAAARGFASLSPHDAPKTFVGDWPGADLDIAKACQTAAFAQTRVNLAVIACSLERYHLAKGEYPKTLEALAPQFIEKIPHDVIGGGPLHYRRADDGKFVLYSIGWNGRDDNGQAGSSEYPYTNGDWVW